MRYPTALTIAGSDSGGGAGIQADLKTFSALGVFGTSAITAITAQNTQEIRALEIVSPSIVNQQLSAVLDDIRIDVIKTGILVTPEIIEIVAHAIDHYSIKQVIVDPVMTATTGTALTKADIAYAIQQLLYTRLTLLTPNIPEVELLTGVSIQTENDCHRAGDTLLNQGCKAVLIKGGHRAGGQSIDILYTANEKPLFFSSLFIHSTNLHGTGCSLASAIAAYIAKGYTLTNAVCNAKEYITSAIEAGADVDFNGGNGPINHLFAPVSLKPSI